MPIDPEHRAQHACEATRVSRRQADHLWRFVELGKGRSEIPLRRWERPADRDACLVGNGGDDPPDFEQAHGGGDVDDEHHDGQGQ